MTKELPENPYEDLATNVVVLISSIHDRERRTQRNIAEKDLKKCVKYGFHTRKLEVKTKENKRGRKFTVKRWRYYYHGITYITDFNSTKAITSWADPLPLPKVTIKDRALEQHRLAKARIETHPEQVTSHTVLVIDQSGSMRSPDVEAHRTRSDAVFYEIATSFIAKKLYKEGESITLFDVVTLIEFRDGAYVTLYREPMTWVLYNMIVQRAKQKKAKSHGRYYPALEAALHALREHDHDNLELLLLFLSDGKPSDIYIEKGNQKGSEVMWKLRCITGKIGLLFQERLKFGMVAFGSDKHGEKILKNMATLLSSAGCFGKFYRSNLETLGSLGTTLAALSTSLHSTKTRLSTISHSKGTVRELEFDTTIEKLSPGMFLSRSEWHIYTYDAHEVQRYELQPIYDRKRKRKILDWRQQPFLHEKAIGIAMKTKPFDKGAERVVFQMCEIDENHRCIGEILVAKEPLHIEQMETKKMEAFQRSFCKTQRMASNKARKFNSRLSKFDLPNSVPYVKFVPCSVYGFYNNEGNAVYVLAEKYLEGIYIKYNDNQGGCRGQKKQQQNTNKRVRFNLVEEIINPTMVESDDEVEDESVSSLTDDDSVNSVDGILDSDVPAAFSHFTYINSRHTQLVCDLQGVLNTERNPPLFELTDPAIHYKSKNGRKRVYGRTDRGNEGIWDFLDTHKCNALCKLLKLDSKTRMRTG